MQEILPLNVLAVDDCDIVRRTLVRQLEKIVKSVTECEDGMKGLLEYQKTEKPFDFIIVDYDMPKMNGITLIEEIRSIEKDKDIKPVPIMRIFFNAFYLI